MKQLGDLITVGNDGFIQELQIDLAFLSLRIRGYDNITRQRRLAVKRRNQLSLVDGKPEG